jgi:RNA polymerase sigma-70 factor (ECF subfamily)
LKHKIIDYYRRASRQVSFVSETEENDFFDESGFWRESPAGWNATPESLLEKKEFEEILQSCLANLPKNLAAVFTLSEIEGLKASEICEILNLSPNNFWVLLHRARLQLRRAIEDRWFGIKTRPKLLNHTGEFVFSN